MGGVKINGWNIPIYDVIMKYLATNPVPFHMPGHKMGKGIPSEFLEGIINMDLTELPETDNLHFPEGSIKEAQRLAARAFGSNMTFFLVNGSTCGIHAAVMTICKPGDKLIVARDCHKSVISAMMLAGAAPVYIQPKTNDYFGISTIIDPSKVDDALHENPDAVGVLITRPNYYGVCSDIQKIAEITHSYDKVLVVDEAHGAHLKFSSRLPICAMDSGSDLCIQSAHKTLAALNQGAYLHVKSHRIDIERLKFYLGILQTSSPSFIILAFLDIARQIMETRGQQLLDGLLNNIGQLEEVLNKNERIVMLTPNSISKAALDRTRVVINVNRTGMTGYQIERLLKKKGNIQVEMSDYSNIVCICTIADKAKDIQTLYTQINRLCEDFKNSPVLSRPDFSDMPIPKQALDFREVLQAQDVRIDLKKACGRISKHIITPYPPGVPLVCPGEIISRDLIEYIISILEAGGTVNGVDSKLTVSVI